MMNALIQIIDHRKHSIIYDVVIPTSLTITNESQKYMYLGYIIRDFRQLLNSLHPQLQHLAWEKLIKKFISRSLSSFNEFTRKSAALNTIYIYIHTHTHTHTQSCYHY